MKKLSYLLLLWSTLLLQSHAQTYNWTPTTISGGVSNGVDTRFFAPGLSTGYFTFSFDFYSIPDAAVITFAGQPVYSTGGYISGAQSVGLQFGPGPAGANSLLQIVLNPDGPRPGTAWTYTVTPTAKPYLVSLLISGAATVAEGGVSAYSAIATFSNGSERVVFASWKAGAPLSLVSASSHAVVKALAVKASTQATLAATYTEDRITVSGSKTIQVVEASIANNPDGEKKLDPNLEGDSKTGGPVHTGTGAESFYRPLIAISGLRDFEFGLNYSSTFSGVSSPNGNGWSHPFAGRALEQSDGSVLLQWSSTRANTYVQVLSVGGAFYTCPDDDAKDDVLAKTADGGFTLTKLDQTVFTFNASGNLIRITNARGQRVNVSAASGILSSIVEPVSGASLSFTNSGGRMTKVTDNAGRIVQMGYTGTLLTSITDLNGNTTAYSYNAEGKLLTVTAPDGARIYSNSYDAKGRVVSQDDGVATNQLMTFSYDESKAGSIVTTVTDRVGAKWVYTHDAQYRLLSVRDPLGAVISHTYDSAGRRLLTRDPLGRITSMSYDHRGNPIHVVRPNGGQTIMQYDLRNNLTSLTNSEGDTATTAYDAANNPVTLVDFNGQQTTRVFNAQSLLTSETSPRNLTTTYGYTAGRLTSVTNPNGEVTGFTYDSVGRVIKRTDAAGKATEFTYRPSGKVLTQTNPAGAQIVNTYDARDRLSSTQDALGGVTARTYDANNNILTVTDAIGGIMRMEYDGEDRLAKVTDARGNAMVNTYDSAGHLLSMTNAEGETTKHKYDLAGNRIGLTDPSGAVTTTIYTAIDLPGSTKDPLGRASAFEYDLLGRITRAVDPLKRANQFAYDGMGRTRETTDPLGFIVRNSYDGDGNRTQLQNAAEATTAFSFDGAGRQSSMSTPLGRTTAYQRDPRGLITLETEPSGQAASFTYDDVGRLIQRSDDAGTITYGYDAKNRLTTTTEGGKTITREYDALDRLVRFTDGDGNVLQYEYDPVGNLLKLTYPDGKAVSYSYDKANRLTQVRDWANRLTTYAYDAVGRLTLTTRPNGTKQERAYDRAGQLTSLRELGPTGIVIAAYAITFDAASQITSEVRTPTQPPVIPQLVSMTYNADDELTSFNGEAVTHDADGNMINGPIGSSLGALAFDARNRLTSAGGVTYRYDAENRRTESETAGLITRYVNNPTGSLWQVLTINASTAATYCVHGIGLIYTETNTEPLYHHYDPRGSTVATTNNAGTTTFHAAYDPYGASMPLAGTPATPFLFVGQWGVMAETNGLSFSRARYYNNTTRRFVNIDPTGLSGGINLFVYAEADPLRRIDPSGEVAPFIIGLGIAWGAFEVGSQIADIINLYNTLNDPNSTPKEKGIAMGGTLLSGVLPGGGYGIILNKADDVADAVKNLDKLSASGKLLDPADKGGNLTRAGRALQKHGSDEGKRAASNAFPKPKGNPSQINQQGQDVLDDILTSPGSTTKSGNRFGGVNIIAPDGRGAQFDSNGQFRGFLEP